MPSLPTYNGQTLSIASHACQSGSHAELQLEPTMTRSPYAPPSSRVADHTLESIPRPKQVTTAVGLLWAVFVLDIPSSYLAASRDPETGFHPLSIAIVVIVSLLVAALIILIYRGHNWARILLLAWFGIGSVAMLMPRDQPVPAGALENALTAVSLLVNVVALYLLFSRPSSSWFGRSSP